MVEIARSGRDEALAADRLSVEQEPAALSRTVFDRRNLLLTEGLFLGAITVFVFVESLFGIGPASVSQDPHFIYQAESLLHGRWDLDLPATVTDIITIHGKHYIVYPPMPAIFMMPFVAIFGLKTSDVLFTMIFAACNLPLLYLLLEQLRANGLTRRSWRENLIITLVLYYGSINLWLSLGGRMWFTASVVCMTCTLLALLLAFRGHFGWSAVLLGCAFFSRATALFGFPFLLFLAWQEAGMGHDLERFVASLRARQPDWRAVPWRRLIPPAAVMAATLVLFLARNYAVFGSPLETGYDILIKQRYSVVKTGPFCLCYVPANIVANFFTFPRITFSGPFGGAFDRHPVFDMLNNGFAVSIFVTTPLFLLLFWRNHRFSLMRAALWVTIGFVVAAVLLFHASGWYQFGARYLYDGYAYLFILLALNDVRVDWRFVALGVLGIGINYLGAFQFWTNRLFQL